MTVRDSAVVFPQFKYVVNSSNFVRCSQQAQVLVYVREGKVDYHQTFLLQRW